MLNAYWRQFKSGSDIRGVATPNPATGEQINLTNDVVKMISLGFVTYLLRQTKKTCQQLRIAVGHDSRISAGRIKNHVIASLVHSGVKVIDMGLSSTPAMFMSIAEFGCDAAIEITASHHPAHKNGFKFFTRMGGVSEEDIDDILQYAQDGLLPPKNFMGSCDEMNFMNMYASYLGSIIRRGVNSNVDYDHPLAGFKIIVDAGNGVGGFYAKRVLEPLGADIEGSQFLKPDGLFPNHIPNPEAKEAIGSLRKAVFETKADLGIIFDTDVDRAAIVDYNGNELNREKLIALASMIALEGNEGGTIVTDSVTSDNLTKYIEMKFGCKHRRFKRGYKNVINEAKRLESEGVNVPLAIETSGHAAFRDNNFLDDGAYLITKLIVKFVEGKRRSMSLTDFIVDFPEPAETEDYRLKINGTNFKYYGEGVINRLGDFANMRDGWTVLDSCEGVRVAVDKGNGDGWFMLRLSVHDPVMPLHIESNVKGGCDEILSVLKEFFAKEEGIGVIE